MTYRDRDLSPYMGDDDEGLTPEQAEEKRMQQLEQVRAQSHQDTQKLQMRDYKRNVEAAKADPVLMAELQNRKKPISAEEFIQARMARPDAVAKRYQKGVREVVNDLFDDQGRYIPPQHSPFAPQEQRNALGIEPTGHIPDHKKHRLNEIAEDRRTGKKGSNEALVDMMDEALGDAFKW